jgi:uncharacterized membrane protein YkvA (DUF1232 family)
MRRLWDAAKERTRVLKQETVSLYWAYRDRRTPWYAKAWVLLVLAYALSPIDLIPDFVPVLGYLDDLLLIPLGIWLALRMIPEPVMLEARIRAQQAHPGPAVPRWLGVGLVLATWAVIVGVVVLVRHRIAG